MTPILTRWTSSGPNWDGHSWNPRQAAYSPNVVEVWNSATFVYRMPHALTPAIVTPLT
jgi:hypothetical protein